MKFLNFSNYSSFGSRDVLVLSRALSRPSSPSFQFSPRLTLPIPTDKLAGLLG
jgi:hypothetical protein